MTTTVIAMPNVEPFDVVELINAKRHGRELRSDEISWLVDGFMREVVAPEQMSALLMTIVFQGMNRREIQDLTAAMISSGETLNLGALGTPAIDKHSTGGVGDKITLPLVPLVASYGVAVPQLSGRGLGHTGGTLDKLESIVGWRADLSNDELKRGLREIGGVICAAGAGLAPADRRMYALRDVTGTVESLPLLASSIMSKKIAEGANGLVLDVKVGSGAFLPDLADAQALAHTMVQLGADSGLETVALLTDMDAPLGRAVGNANEVQESLEVLAGGGPADVVSLTVELAKEMLALAGQHGVDPAENLQNGRAMDVWRRMIVAQGGDPAATLPTVNEHAIVRAERAGYANRIDARRVGVAAWRLGAGRAKPGDPIDHSAGVEVLVNRGDKIRVGDPLFIASCDNTSRLARGLETLASAVELGLTPPEPRSLILDRIVA